MNTTLLLQGAAPQGGNFTIIIMMVVDPKQIVLDKMKISEKKYPIEKAKGNTQVPELTDRRHKRSARRRHLRNSEARRPDHRKD